jgi:hypothetical protein
MTIQGKDIRPTESKAHCSSGDLAAAHLFTNSENVPGVLTWGASWRVTEGVTSRVLKSLLSPLGRKIPPPTLLGRTLSRVCFASLNVDGWLGLTSTRATGETLGAACFSRFEAEGGG